MITFTYCHANSVAIRVLSSKLARKTVHQHLKVGSVFSPLLFDTLNISLTLIFPWPFWGGNIIIFHYIITKLLNKHYFNFPLEILKPEINNYLLYPTGPRGGVSCKFAFLFLSVFQGT